MQETRLSETNNKFGGKHGRLTRWAGSNVANTMLLVIKCMTIKLQMHWFCLFPHYEEISLDGWFVNNRGITLTFLKYHSNLSDMNSLLFPVPWYTPGRFLLTRQRGVRVSAGPGMGRSRPPWAQGQALSLFKEVTNVSVLLTPLPSHGLWQEHVSRMCPTLPASKPTAGC